jgi:hypothetical protein
MIDDYSKKSDPIMRDKEGMYQIHSFFAAGNYHPSSWHQQKYKTKLI